VRVAGVGKKADKRLVQLDASGRVSPPGPIDRLIPIFGLNLRSILTE
jgi:hypothetical protein